LGLLAYCCATSIGQVAFEILSAAKDLTVMGVSSSGLFLMDPLGGVVFVSFEHFRGPVTITAPSASSRMKGASAGTPVQVEHGWISFPDQAVAIPFSRDLIWKPMPPRWPADPAESRKRKLEMAAARACAEKDGHGWSSLLATLVNGRGVENLAGEERFTLERIGRFQTAMRQCDGVTAGACLKELLGLGQGLTPSGDDMVAGLLLALNRWREVLRPETFMEEVNQSVAEWARLHTTALSATLIECAARGLASERLIHALDSIMTGTPSLDDSLPPLLQWGASSGIDSLLGMAVAIIG